MTAKEFFNGVYHFPASVFSGTTDLLLGSFKRNKQGDVKAHEEPNRGLLGYVLDIVKAIGRGIATFIGNHKTAIATAFWASLVLAGGAVLTLYLWPAALTAVTTFTVAGLSIAGLVGNGLLPQLGLVAALTTVAASTSTYLIAAVVNTVNWIKDLLQTRKPNSESLYDELVGASNEKGNEVSSPSSVLSKLNASNSPSTPEAANEEHTDCAHSKPLFTAVDKDPNASGTNTPENEPSSPVHKAF